MGVWLTLWWRAFWRGAFWRKRAVTATECDPPNNPCVYHYTDLNALLGILESGEIWASDCRFLNDGLEIKYTLSAFRDYLDRRREKEVPDHGRDRSTHCAPDAAKPPRPTCGRRQGRLGRRKRSRRAGNKATGTEPEPDRTAGTDEQRHEASSRRACLSATATYFQPMARIRSQPTYTLGFAAIS